MHFHVMSQSKLRVWTRLFRETTLALIGDPHLCDGWKLNKALIC